MALLHRSRTIALTIFFVAVFWPSPGPTTSSDGHFTSTSSAKAGR